MGKRNVKQNIKTYQSSIETIYQTSGGIDLYPSIEEKYLPYHLHHSKKAFHPPAAVFRPCKGKPQFP